MPKPKKGDLAEAVADATAVAVRRALSRKKNAKLLKRAVPAPTPRPTLRAPDPLDDLVRQYEAETNAVVKSAVGQAIVFERLRRAHIQGMI